jgi:hypothetical protein
MVFGGKETFKVYPGFFGWKFLAPFFAAIAVLTTGADVMIGSLEDLVGSECDMAIGCVLDAVLNLLEEHINREGGVERLIHAFFACFDVGRRDLPVSIKEMVQEMVSGYPEVSGVFVKHFAKVSVINDGVDHLGLEGIVYVGVVVENASIFGVFDFVGILPSNSCMMGWRGGPWVKRSDIWCW